MSYYVRAFCTSEGVPPLRAVLDWADAQGVRLDAPSADLDGRDWNEAEVVYKPDRQPFIAVVNTNDLVRDEVAEFVEFLEDVADVPEKQKVLDHLHATKSIVAAQLLGDIDEDGGTAVGAFLTYFVEHNGGLIQADGEGFYEGERLIVELGCRKIPAEAVAEAAKTPGAGWVYAMEAPEDFDYVPPERIRGAWKVDEDGQITGEFEKNPNYVPRWRRFVRRFRTRSL